MVHWDLVQAILLRLPTPQEYFRVAHALCRRSRFDWLPHVLFVFCVRVTYGLGIVHDSVVIQWKNKRDLPFMEEETPVGRRLHLHVPAFKFRPLCRCCGGGITEKKSISIQDCLNPEQMVSRFSITRALFDRNTNDFIGAFVLEPLRNVRQIWLYDDNQFQLSKALMRKDGTFQVPFQISYDHLRKGVFVAFERDQTDNEWFEYDDMYVLSNGEEEPEPKRIHHMMSVRLA
jgi:hypothetical protein